MREPGILTLTLRSRSSGGLSLIGDLLHNLGEHSGKKRNLESRAKKRALNKVPHLKSSPFGRGEELDGTCARLDEHAGLDDGGAGALWDLRRGFALHRLLEDRCDSIGFLMRALLFAFLEFRQHLL